MFGVFIRCAKLVEGKNDRMFRCLSVRDFEQKILINSVHFLQTQKKNVESFYFSYEKGYTNC